MFVLLGLTVPDRQTVVRLKTINQHIKIIILIYMVYNMGINLNISCDNFYWVPWKLFKHETTVFKGLPMDPANVNTRKSMADRYFCINFTFSIYYYYY